MGGRGSGERGEGGGGEGGGVEREGSLAWVIRRWHVYRSAERVHEFVHWERCGCLCATSDMTLPVLYRGRGMCVCVGRGGE